MSRVEVESLFLYLQTLLLGPEPPSMVLGRVRSIKKLCRSLSPKPDLLRQTARAAMLIAIVSIELACSSNAGASEAVTSFVCAVPSLIHAAELYVELRSSNLVALYIRPTSLASPVTPHQNAVMIRIRWRVLTWPTIIMVLGCVTRFRRFLAL
ncbi:hypothetical protein DENSPDRAFT_60560 [Dentipellis sp. KUC8613]|nr:hypothetical protein DENSPDRAFT_60560 [Dentipellis sp. KUC8613]